MGTPAVSEDQARELIAVIEQALRQGHRPFNVAGSGRSSVTVASEMLGISYSSTFNRMLRAKENYNLEPDWSVYTPARYVQPMPKQVLYPAAKPEPQAYLLDGQREQVLMIGDLHNDPRHPHRTEILTWLARLGSERKVKRVVQVGDWGTFDGASFHDKNDTLRARLKPSIRSDLDNHKESLIAWNRGRDPDWKPKLDITLGNHEYRLNRFENANPETVGVFTGELEQNFMQFGWKTRPYGEVMFVQGVGISHHPVNGAGRAFGGKTGPQRAANELTCSFISGHTHAYQHFSTGKIGMTTGVDVMEVGCALPWGEVEDYASHAIINWWYGAVIVDLMGGRIVASEKIDMMRIRDRYSDAGG